VGQVGGCDGSFTRKSGRDSSSAEQALKLAPKLKQKPKVVTSEAKVVRDADVLVSKSDPNYPGSDEGVIRVRRADFVTLRLDLYEEQQHQRREDRLRRQEAVDWVIGAQSMMKMCEGPGNRVLIILEHGACDG
jgi:hypothetical protein